MRTQNEIEVVGEPERVAARVYQLAADLQDWPKILPHYRYLNVTEQTDTHKIADFGATRDGFPVKWSARQELFPNEQRITFKHIKGITRGMWVEWRIEKLSNRVRVTIDHELTYPIPLLGNWFARYIVGGMFVHNIAGKTLRCMKDKIEAEAENAPSATPDSKRPASAAEITGNQ